MSPLEAARHYVGLGLSVIPIRADGTKAPALGSWKEYQRRLPREDELEEWFANGHALGVAVVCGEVSRNLEVLDFDSDAAYRQWARRVLAERPDALEALPCVRTPSGGRHLYLFRAEAGPSRKLAKSADGKKTLVEVKAEGGYVLAPGCPGACHPTGRAYEWELPLSEPHRE
jgi:hypothetical protein